VCGGGGVVGGGGGAWGGKHIIIEAAPTNRAPEEGGLAISIGVYVKRRCAVARSVFVCRVSGLFCCRVRVRVIC